MPFHSIKISQLRNIENASLHFNKNLNVFFGKNASGKSSLLESLYLLSTTKSFRTRKIKSLVNDTHQSKAGDYCVVFGEIENKNGEFLKVGVKKSINDGTVIKLDEVLEKSSSNLARQIAVFSIGPDSFEILDGAPKLRRKFLDWGVFHVEHSFSETWSNYQYCLKQRNSLLRMASIDRSQIIVWDRKLAELGNLIDQRRSTYFSAFLDSFSGVCEDICPELVEGLSLNYHRGWDSERSLLEVLEQTFTQDAKRKHTQYGAQRTDLKITSKSKPVIEVFSRGQLKKLLVALSLTHILTLKNQFGIKSVVLFDDISAELDEINTQKVVQNLLKLQAQVFCTMLEDLESKQHIFDKLQEEYSMFHVEHGKIHQVEK